VANVYRQLQNYLFGTLTAGIASGDLTMTSASFAGLPVVTLGAFLYIPLALQDPSTGKFEVVWVTAHAAASTTVTIIRGQEGSLAQSWASGSLVGDAPLLRDLLTISAYAGMPADGHYGLRAIDPNTGVTYEATPNGYLASVKSKQGANTPSIGGVATPAGAQLWVASGSFSVTTNATGDFTVPFQISFPTACVSVTANPTAVAGATTSFICSGATNAQWTGRAKNAAANVASTTVTGTYIAVGY
jgi:hypothetical protein